MDFWGPILGGSRWSFPKKFREKKLRLQLNNFTQKLNFDLLWFRRRAYKIRKKKKEKKKRKKPHRGQKWVGWDKRVSWGIQPYKMFFALYKPFLTETGFYAKLSGRFSGSKTKLT